MNDENNYSGRLSYNFAEAAKIKGSIFHVGIAGFTEDYAVKPKTSSNGGAGANATTHSRLFNFKSAGRGYSPLAALDVQGEYLTNGGASEPSKTANHHENRFAALEGIFAKAHLNFKLNTVKVNLKVKMKLG